MVLMAPETIISEIMVILNVDVISDIPVIFTI